MPITFNALPVCFFRLWLKLGCLVRLVLWDSAPTPFGGLSLWCVLIPLLALTACSLLNVRCTAKYSWFAFHEKNFDVRKPQAIRVLSSSR
jgi:hypothetical protein